jgi:ubiquinone/menaquinone biosynthesis C-methylase UbiE
MTQQITSSKEDSRWADEKLRRRLARRVDGFWNRDYFEGIVLPLLDLRQGANVLDVGAGYGALSLLLARTRPDLDVIGMDPVQQTVAGAAQAAAEMGLSNVSFRQGDGHAIPFDDNSFDACLCQTVLTHVADAGKVVSEMARVMRPGGKFLAVEYHNAGAISTFLNVTEGQYDDSQLVELFRLQRLYIKGKKALGQGDEMTGMRVPALVQEAGLDLIDVRLSDRAIFAVPPYRTSYEQMTLENLRELYADENPEQSEFSHLSECILAGGGTQHDIDQFIKLTDSPEDRRTIRTAIAENRLYFFNQWPWFLTFARKAN